MFVTSNYCYVVKDAVVFTASCLLLHPGLPRSTFPRKQHVYELAPLNETNTCTRTHAGKQARTHARTHAHTHTHTHTLGSIWSRIAELSLNLKVIHNFPTAYDECTDLQRILCHFEVRNVHNLDMT